MQSKLLVKGANRRIMSLDNHVGMVSSKPLSLATISDEDGGAINAWESKSLRRFLC